MRPTSITIPESVTDIGILAFSEFEGLKIYGYENSYAQKYAKEEYIHFEILNSAADLNNDGKVNVMDAIELKMILLKYSKRQMKWSFTISRYARS